MAHKDMYYQAGKLSTCGSALRRDFRPSVTATVDRPHGGGRRLHLRRPEHGRVRAEPDRATTRRLATATIRGTCPTSPAGRRPGRGPRSRRASTTWRWGPTPAGRSGFPPRACGVTGLKPTQTRVSRYGVMPLSFSHDNVGPLARTARDCARVLAVIAGHDPLDPTSSREPVPDYEAAMTGDCAGCGSACRPT